MKDYILIWYIHIEINFYKVKYFLHNKMTQQLRKSKKGYYLFK